MFTSKENILFNLFYSSYFIDFIRFVKQASFVSWFSGNTLVRPGFLRTLRFKYLLLPSAKIKAEFHQGLLGMLVLAVY